MNGPSSPFYPKMQKLRGELKNALVARDREVDGLLTALVSGNNILLLGPPGTAKTMLSSMVSSSIGGSFFSQLLTGFSTPEEVFGPYDMPALQQSQYKRATAGYMPESHVALVDEVFKANSAILNSMLTLINEGTYKEGPVSVRSPLMTTVGCSNEYPSETSLEALYDRFMLRFWVPYLKSRGDRFKLLTCKDPATQITTQMTLEEFEELRAETSRVSIPDDVLHTLLDCQDAIAREHGIVVSDRRLRNTKSIIRGRAYMSGRMVATNEDLCVLADSLWDRHEQRPAIASTVMSIVAPHLSKLSQLRDAAVEEFVKVDDYKDTKMVTAVLSRIKSIDSEAVAIVGDNEEAAQIYGEIVEMRKQVARGFMQSTGLF